MTSQPLVETGREQRRARAFARGVALFSVRRGTKERAVRGASTERGCVSRG
jgi:hypothetical protein